MRADAVRDRSQWVGITCLAAMILLVLFVRFCNRGGRQEHLPVSVVVAVEGEVKRPGFYILEEPSATVAQAVSAAGGCRNNHEFEGACNSLWSRRVHKGELLDVKCPESGTAAVEIRPMPAGALISVGGKLDLNRAVEDELSLVPGMREDFSRYIVKRRAQQSWQSLEELTEVPGVGPKTVEKWKEYLEAGR